MILMTGLDDHEIDVKAAEAGAFDYLVKGKIDASALERSIRYALQRAEAADALRVSERKMRQLFDSAPVGYHELDVAGRIVEVNKTELGMLGRSASEMLGLHPWDFMVSLEGEQEAYEAAVAGTAAPPESIEQLYRRKDGTTLRVLTQGVLLRSDAGETLGMRVTLQDITERKHLEEQLRQAQKLEAIGTLAGGIAHDFNNMLTAIMSYAELSLDRLEPSDPVSENLKEVTKAAERSADLTRQLLAFSRRQTIEPKVLDLNELILDIDRMLRHLVKESTAP